MARRISTPMARKLIFEERECSDVGEDSDVEADEDISELEDNISENSELEDISEISELESEFDDDVLDKDFDPSTKGEPAPGTSHQQRAIGDIFRSRSGDITWSSYPSKEPARRASKILKVRPGPTKMSVTLVKDVRSAFDLLMPDSILQIVLDCTNLEGRRVYGEKWEVMDMTLLYAYLGLLYLGGVFRSKGESMHSLWDVETGREIFGATMPLDTFQAISRVIRFDNRDDKPARRQKDKLAAIRTVWDEWVYRLPLFYNPGPNVTIDEQLIPFRGCCPFRQYMPSKPAKYGIKIWAACDTATSYAWNLQVYTGQPGGGVPERNQAMRVVLDLSQDLEGHNITCDNFFTSYELGQELLKRKLTMVGTIRKNKPELPPQLLETRGRSVNSSKFLYTADTSLVSYVPRRRKNVLLMSTLHRSGKICGQKPEIIMHYNATKGAVDNLDKLVTVYSCKRGTLRWPLAIFFDMLDISAYNAFVVWTAIKPRWNQKKLQRRRFFLEELGKALVIPYMQTRRGVPRTPAVAAMMKRIQGENAAGSSIRSPSTRSSATRPLSPRSPSIRSPSIRSPSIRSPSPRPPSARSPSARSPVGRSPSARSPSARSPSARSPSTKSPAPSPQTYHSTITTA
uniref:PiggyBac transposable element-derived protein domain-containing protein n=1 Tax=Monopterus albus TaxID=43700 RepID=A0A3Q3KRH5_MONAL